MTEPEGPKPGDGKPAGGKHPIGRIQPVQQVVRQAVGGGTDGNAAPAGKAPAEKTAADKTPADKTAAAGRTPQGGTGGAVMPVRKKQDMDSHARQFLPAALEIMETPASPAGRWTAIAISTFFAVSIIWAAIGEVDVVAVAPGKVVPVGGVKPIQSTEIGRIRSIHVKEGDQVKAGDVLIELDPTDTDTDLDQLERESIKSEVELASLRAMKAAIDRQPDPTLLPVSGLVNYGRIVPASADLNLQNLYRESLIAELGALSAALEELVKEEGRLWSERKTIEVRIITLKKALPLAAREAQAQLQLREKGHTRVPELNEKLLRLYELEGELKTRKAALQELDTALSAVEQARNRTRADFRHEISTRAVEADDRFRQADIAFKRAQNAQEERKLRAPVDGIVDQIAVSRDSGVVQPIEQLMVIVPTSAPIEIEAKLLNKDKGFVKPGQEAAVKIDSYKFTTYGFLEGEVTDVSANSIADENFGEVFKTVVRPHEEFMWIDGERQKITAGMTASVEVIIGTRRVIEYLLSPLLRYKDESLREK